MFPAVFGIEVVLFFLMQSSVSFIPGTLQFCRAEAHKVRSEATKTATLQRKYKDFSSEKTTPTVTFSGRRCSSLLLCVSRPSRFGTFVFAGWNGDADLLTGSAAVKSQCRRIVCVRYIHPSMSRFPATHPSIRLSVCLSVRTFTSRLLHPRFCPSKTFIGVAAPLIVACIWRRPFSRRPETVVFVVFALF